MKIEFKYYIIIISLVFFGCSTDNDSEETSNINNVNILNPQDPSETQNNIPERFISLTGEASVIGVKQDGTLWAWGKNVSGEMGNGQTSSYTNNFLPYHIGTDTNWKTVEYSGSSVIGLKTDGTIWRWGTVVNLQNHQNVLIPFPSQIGTDNDWKKVVGTSAYYIGIKENGSLWGWGFYNYIGLGYTPNPYLTPIMLNNGIWKDIAKGVNHSILLKNDGTLWALGNNNFGALGNGTETFSNYILTQIGNSTDWKSISTGEYSNFAIKENGTLWAWGRNLFGVLGLGDNVDRYSVTQVGTDSDWKKVYTCGKNTIFLKNNGKIYGCGSLMTKYIGISINSVTETYSPVQLNNNTDWENVYCTDNAFFANKINLDTWGIGYSYSLGINTSNFFNLAMTPVAWN